MYVDTRPGYIFPLTWLTDLQGTDRTRVAGEVGRNRLGFLWMSLRDELRAEAAQRAQEEADQPSV